MTKNILVHIPTERAIRPVVDVAISLDTTFSAHVDALAAGYIPTSAAYVVDSGAAVAAVFETEQRRAAEHSAAALAVSETEARNAGMSYQCRSIEDLPVEASSALGDAARPYDLTVVQQPDAALQPFDNDGDGNSASGRRPCAIRTPYLSRLLRAQAHRHRLGWKPACRTRAQGRLAVFAERGRSRLLAS